MSEEQKFVAATKTIDVSGQKYYLEAIVVDPDTKEIIPLGARLERLEEKVDALSKVVLELAKGLIARGSL